MYALIGLSLGAQIIVETLSQKNDIAEYAVIESALVYPLPCMRTIAPVIIKSSYGLIQKRWFSIIQAKELCLPKDKWDLYFEDSVKISKQSLINISESSIHYTLKGSISYTKAKILIIAGEKETSKMLPSAETLHAKLSDSRLYIAKNMKHGELSLSYTQRYLELINTLLKNEYQDIIKN